MYKISSVVQLRPQDSGIGVRKRVIKILIGIFGTSGDATIRADICCRLIEVMEDQDDNVKVSWHTTFLS